MRIITIKLRDLLLFASIVNCLIATTTIAAIHWYASSAVQSPSDGGPRPEAVVSLLAEPSALVPRRTIDRDALPNVRVAAVTAPPRRSRSAKTPIPAVAAPTTKPTKPSGTTDTAAGTTAMATHSAGPALPQARHLQEPQWPTEPPAAKEATPSETLAASKIAGTEAPGPHATRVATVSSRVQRRPTSDSPSCELMLDPWECRALQWAARRLRVAGVMPKIRWMARQDDLGRHGCEFKTDGAWLAQMLLMPGTSLKLRDQVWQLRRKLEQAGVPADLVEELIQWKHLAARRGKRPEADPEDNDGVQLVVVGGWKRFLSEAARRQLGHGSPQSAVPRQRIIQAL